MSDLLNHAEGRVCSGATGQPFGAASSRAKRLCDVGISAAALLFIIPALVVIALAICATSKGPILFRQRRTGLNGRPFQILKFRTMKVLQDGDDVRHATRADQRITRVGAFLRRSSLDELPQLLNVLRGDMSLVGPRPHALVHDRHYAAALPEYGARFRTRPGLTGLAQISGLRGEVKELDAMRKRVGADIEYIDHWSFWMDISIMARTVPLVLNDPNAF